MTPLVVGNWKMHGGPATSVKLARELVSGLDPQRLTTQIVVAPPFTDLLEVKKCLTTSIALAAQNCHCEDSGAFTGEISPAMLAEIDCGFVIIGHSERRHLFSETNELIEKKLSAVLRHRMRPILCIGETLQERKNGETEKVITQQLDSVLKQLSEDAIGCIEFAYEPVWAIGTGMNASIEQIRDAHALIRRLLNGYCGEAGAREIRIVYGGSVKPENAALIAGVDGVSGLLVGGASLSAESFLKIARAFSH